MPNNFRLAGSVPRYISKAGNDTTGTGTAEAPYASLAKGNGNQNNIVGTGSYRYLATTSAYGSAGFTADGFVKFIGDGTNRQAIAEGNNTITGIYYDQFFGFNFRFYNQDLGGNNFNRCIFKALSNTGTANSGIWAGPTTSGSTPTTYNDCIFYNVNMAQLGTGWNQVFNRCLFFNCTIPGARGVNNCYIDSTSSIATVAASQCNVDPNCNTQNNKGINVNGSGWSKTTTGGISALPLFNALAKEDWSLQRQSPHIPLNIGPAHLGFSNSYFLELVGTNTGQDVTTANVVFRSLDTGTATPLVAVPSAPDALLVNNQGGLVRRPTVGGTGVSVFRTGVVPFSDQVREMTMMNPFAGLNFDTDYPAIESGFATDAPQVFNNNVPTISNGTSGSAKRNPNRLTYRMRWSTLAAPDLNTPGHWQLGNVWVEFEWWQKPLYVQASNIGNGDPAFTAAGSVGVFCRSYQLEIAQRDNYYSR